MADRLHVYIVVESTTPGVYNAFCAACSETDYVHPCRLRLQEPVPGRLVAADQARASTGEAP